VRAVRRNRDRFPDDFTFQLSHEEFADLRRHSGTSRSRGGRRYRPFAFTEQGAGGAGFRGGGGYVAVTQKGLAAREGFVAGVIPHRPVLNWLRRIPSGTPHFPAPRSSRGAAARDPREELER